MCDKNNNKNFWWTVDLNLNNDNDEEILNNLAILSGALGSEILLNSNGKNYLRAYFNSNDDPDEIIKKFKELANNNINDYKIFKTNNQAWDTQHYEAFPPLEVGKNLIVSAPWHEDKIKNQPDRLAIYIFPASAFGTGYHESTQIALTLLEETVKPQIKILDVGTGSGILFITALKLGAKFAYARDIDPIAITEAERNMKLNNIDKNLCKIEVADLLKNFDDRVNILTANILLAPNLELLPNVKNILEPDGVAIFSGMTVKEREKFIDGVNKNSGLKIVSEIKLNDWWGCKAVIA